jgi:uncharacterized OB-fold protein
MTVIPTVDDHDTAGFFQAAADGRLVVRRCSSCTAVLHMPVSYCTCGSFDVDWVEVAPAGRIYSYAVVSHQVHPDFPVPYTVILVELSDVPEVRLIGHLDGRPDVYIGQPVVAEMRALPHGAALPTWRIA